MKEKQRRNWNQRISTTFKEPCSKGKQAWMGAWKESRENCDRENNATCMLKGKDLGKTGAIEESNNMLEPFPSVRQEGMRSCKQVEVGF